MKKLRHDVARRDHYEELTNTIISKLEEGVLPWRRPWDPRKCPASASPILALRLIVRLRPLAMITAVEDEIHGALSLKLAA